MGRTASASLTSPAAQALQKSPPLLCASPGAHWISPSESHLLTWQKTCAAETSFMLESGWTGARALGKGRGKGGRLVCAHTWEWEGKAGPQLNSTKISLGQLS